MNYKWQKLVTEEDLEEVRDRLIPKKYPLEVGVSLKDKTLIFNTTKTIPTGTEETLYIKSTSVPSIWLKLERTPDSVKLCTGQAYGGYAYDKDVIYENGVWFCNTLNITSDMTSNDNIISNIDSEEFNEYISYGEIDDLTKTANDVLELQSYKTNLVLFSLSRGGTTLIKMAIPLKYVSRNTTNAGEVVHEIINNYGSKFYGTICIANFHDLTNDIHNEITYHRDYNGMEVKVYLSIKRLHINDDGTKVLDEYKFYENSTVLLNEEDITSLAYLGLEVL